MATMDLHSDLGDAEFARYLLVHEAIGDVCHHLPLARGQRVEQGSQFRNGLFAIASFLISLERPDHGIQDILVTERLGQEVDGSSFHCLDRHRNVAVTRHKDDRDANIRLSQFGLKVETADPGSLISRTRQLATFGILICANSWAEPNSSTRKPIDRKRLLRVARIAISSSMTKTIDSLALAGSCDDLARSVTTHPLDARAGRIETSHRGVRLPWPTAGHRGLPRLNGRSIVPYP